MGSMSLVHHVAFRTSDVEALAAFYRRWLKLMIVKDQRPRSLWLGRLGDRCVLMIEQRALDEPPLREGSYELVAFHVDEQFREQVAADLNEQGLLEARTEHTLYFRDPDGRRVGVSSYPL
jgi:catechol 2,3-dioxygenase-like lactoylglutathione lyase family enzyme